MMSVHRRSAGLLSTLLHELLRCQTPSHRITRLVGRGHTEAGLPRHTSALVRVRTGGSATTMSRRWVHQALARGASMYRSLVTADAAAHREPLRIFHP